MEHFVEFKNIVKRFGNFTALNHVTLGIPKGAFVTLLGPSGCGKTTLMRQLAGFSEPDEGEIFIGGRRMNGLPPFERGTPLVFQEYALFPHMTVYENISYGLRLRKEPKAAVKQKVLEMLEIFTLAGLEGRFPGQLSGGQQQRVAFARALVMGQEVLLLDEPLSNLDAKLRVEVRGELRQIQQRLGITAIYVTHDQDEALSMSDTIAVMQNGRIEQVGTPQQIYFKPANRFVAGFVGTVNLLEATMASKGGRLLAECCGQPLALAGTEGLAPGDRVTLAIRPEYLRLAPQNEKAPAGGFLEGEIQRHSFLGRVTQYWVRAGAHTLVVEESNPPMAPPLEGHVQIVVDTEKIHAIKEAPPHADDGIH
ncbi:MAG: ABC transporter ATP-binding protein [Oscillospiraceae bacterium]